MRLQDGEAFLDSLTVTPSAHARKGLLEELPPTRLRKLLMLRSELTKLGRRVAERGYTLVPLAVTYNGKLKLQIGLAKGKTLANKREAVKDRDIARETARQLKDL